jgi:hypothetical protein
MEEMLAWRIGSEPPMNAWVCSALVPFALSPAIEVSWIACMAAIASGDVMPNSPASSMIRPPFDCTMLWDAQRPMSPSTGKPSLDSWIGLAASLKPSQFAISTSGLTPTLSRMSRL